MIARAWKALGAPAIVMSIALYTAGVFGGLIIAWAALAGFFAALSFLATLRVAEKFL